MARYLSSLFPTAVSAAAAAAALLLGSATAHAAGTVGSSFPADFPAIEDASLARPVIGFGAAGAVARTPVIFLHGNNDTPYPTSCSRFGRMQAFAQHFADNGYSPAELWALGYEGDQCDLPADQTRRSSIAHTNQANVPDLRRFVAAVLKYTGAKQVDIVAHSLGVTLAREWMRQDEAGKTVRRFVAIDGPNQGIINCSPDPLNYFQAAAAGGFKPSAEVCVELGSPNTPFLKLLNARPGPDHDHGRGGRHDDDGRRATPRTLVVRNADKSFVFYPLQDGFIAPVPAQDSFGQAFDFSHSAEIPGAKQLDLVGQGVYDTVLGTTHLGILNSPATRQAAFEFLSAPGSRR